MTNYEELKTTLIMRLYELATEPGNSGDFSGRQIIALLEDLTGAAVTKAAFQELLNDKYLRQTKTISDEDEGWYEITTSFISLAEGIRKNQPSKGRKGAFRRFRESLLIALAKKEEESGSDYYDLKEVADEAGIKYSEGWVSKAAYSFRDQGLINEAFTMGGGVDGNLQAILTAEGLETAQELMEQSASSSAWDEAEWDKVDWAGENQDGLIATELHGVEQNSPALNDVDVWEPLPLEASSAEVAETADEVEELIEAVRGDNGYTATHPEEQKSILWALGSGVNALREGLVTRYALENFLRNPLQRLIERFKGAAIQIFSQKLLEKILGFFSGG